MWVILGYVGMTEKKMENLILLGNILGRYRDNEERDGNYHLRFMVTGLGFSCLVSARCLDPNQKPSTSSPNPNLRP